MTPGPGSKVMHRSSTVRRSRARRAAQAALDSISWMLGIVAGAALVESKSPPAAVVTVALLAGVVQLGSGILVGITRGRWRVSSFDEVPPLAASVVLTAVIVLILDALLPPRWSVGWQAVAIGALLAGLLLAMSRFARRWRVFRGRRPEGAIPTIVFGAGEGGSELTASMLRDPRSPLLPVALLDDDPRRRGVRIRGIRVSGGRECLASEIERTGAVALLIAIPSADRATVASISDAAHSVGLDVKVAPTLRELIGRNPTASEVRDLGPADLLGRQEVKTSSSEIAKYIKGRRVLVTGAGGSIGSELCRQLHQHAPASLILLDRDESALHAVKLLLDGRALLDTPDVVLADLRDPPRIRAVLAEHRPHVVFHAAALKHLPLLERYPGEAILTNVWGTLDLVDAAVDAGVQRFVNISTDKAADPVNVLGYSKRIAERITAAHAGDGAYLSVRFGNVLGSRGSSLVAFERQIASGGPVTVTDPDVTRYFMTVAEAVELVVQAGAIGSPGEVMVLDMGEPVRIDALVKRLIAQSGREIAIVYSGLRPGEKLHEDLFGADEVPRGTAHPMISSVIAEGIDVSMVRALDPTAPPADAIANLRNLATQRQDAVGRMSR